MKRALLQCLTFVYLFFLVQPAIASELSIVAAGDTCFSGRLEIIGQTRGYDWFFGQTSPTVREGDIAFLNLETSVSRRGRPVRGKEFVFRSPPDCLEAIKKAGFDVVSVANNHALDYGDVAFLDTLKHLKASGLLHVGGGEKSLHAYSPSLLNVKGIKVAFFAFSDVVPPGFAATEKKPGIASLKNEKTAIKTVFKWSKVSDVTIVSVHWGKELGYLPSERQIRIAHRLIEAGADLILGHHPHVVQPVEVYRNRAIAYSLGNFIFSPGGDAGRYTMLLKVNTGFSGEIKSIEVLPLEIRNGRPEQADDSRMDRLRLILSGRGVNFAVFNDRLVFGLTKESVRAPRQFIYFERKYFAGFNHS